jgi:hypothetical protein
MKPINIICGHNVEILRVKTGGIYTAVTTRYSLCRLIRLLSTWRRVAAFFSSNIYDVHCAGLSCRRAAAFFSSNIHDVHCAGLSDFSVRDAARRHFSRPIYTMFIVQAYHTSKYVMPPLFLVQYTRCSLCRLVRLFSTWRHEAAFFSSNIHGVNCAGLSDFSVCGATRRHFSCPIYTVFIVQAYQTSQYVLPCGGIFLGKWRSSFAGNSDDKMNVQSA